MDVAWLRREVFADGAVSREAADELFLVERAGVAQTPAWTELFVEMITEHVVWQSAARRGSSMRNRPEWLIQARGFTWCLGPGRAGRALLERAGQRRIARRAAVPRAAVRAQPGQ